MNCSSHCTKEACYWKSIWARRFPWIAAVSIALASGVPFRAQEPDPKRDGIGPFVAFPVEMPAPKDNPTSPGKVALGRQLFFDPRLSGDNSMSCATCHLPEKAFGDGLQRAKGRGGKELARNTPSLLNVSLHSVYLWDGRVKSLEEQALGPIISADEMNQDLGELEKELSNVPGYVQQFRTVFETPVTRLNIARALAAFQRTLVSRNSPFDRHLSGDKKALTEAAQRGMELFRGDAGCSRCHSGPLLSDDKFYRLGVGNDDRGLGAITNKKEDHYKFRTPALRDIARTGPYMHDGSKKTLFEVVEYYYRRVPPSGPERTSLDIEPLLGNSFSEISDIVAFLESLSGEGPVVEIPVLPK